MNQFQYFKRATGVIILFLVLNTCEKSEPRQIKIETGNMISFTSSSVTFEGSMLDLGEGITTYGHMLSTDSSYTSDVKESTFNNPTEIGPYTSTIANLIPETQYYVRAYATGTEVTVYGISVPCIIHETGTFVDGRDNHEYGWVKIGDQIWMKENLAYLPIVGPLDSISDDSPCYYVAEYEGSSVDQARATENYSTYGVLYNWPAAMNGEKSSEKVPSGVRGVCPVGWHLPSYMEWIVLIYEAGGREHAAHNLRETGYSHWKYSSISNCIESTNNTGFTALPGDNGMYWYYQNIASSGKIDGTRAFWWTATENGAHDFTTAEMIKIGSCYDGIDLIDYLKNYCFSVRCIKD